MRILVAGGTGFLGASIAFYLRSLGHQVTIQGRSEKKCRQMEAAGFKVFKEELNQGSLAKQHSLVRKACHFQDIVINCIGEVRPYGTLNDFYPANYESANVLALSCLAAERKPKLIHISSACVLADLKPHLNLSEGQHFPAKAACEYTESKLLSEIAIKRYQQVGLRAIILRPSLVYGTPTHGGPSDKKIFTRLLQLHQKGRLPILANGNALIDLTHIDNLVKAVTLCVNDDKMLGKIFHITDGDPRPLKEILMLLFKELGVEARIKQLGLEFQTAAKWLKIPEKLIYPLLKKLGIEVNPTLTPFTLSLLALSQTHDINLAKQYGYEPSVKVEAGLKTWVQHSQKKHPTRYGDKNNFFMVASKPDALNNIQTTETIAKPS